MSSPLSIMLGLADELPAAPTPLGSTANFSNGGGVSSLIVQVETFCVALSTMVMAIRLYTRAVIMKALGAEDWLALLGWAAFMALYAVSLVDVSHKGAWHQYDLLVGELGPVLYWDYIASIPTPVACALVRISILVQYLNIFQPRQLGRGFFWWACWILIIFVVLYSLVLLMILIFICTPREKFWMPFKTSGSCLDEHTVDLWGLTFNMILDIAILIMPQPCIWGLHMRLMKKLGVSALFLIGLFAVTCSAVKVYFAVMATQSTDELYFTTMLGMWTSPELASCILASCLPSLAKFCRTMLERYRNTSSNHGLVLSPDSPALQVPSPQFSSAPSSPRKLMWPAAMGQVYVPPESPLGETRLKRRSDSDRVSDCSSYSAERGCLDSIDRELAAVGSYRGSSVETCWQQQQQQQHYHYDHQEDMV